MSVFAIGDLHLSLTTKKPMDIFGDAWSRHVERLNEGFKTVSDNDVIILAGDTSWGISLEEALEDFKFVDALPGKKLLLKGNHDYWWETVSKIHRFFEENNIKTIDVLHNNAFLHGDVAICGTRGWFPPDDGAEDGNKIYMRELGRLQKSLEEAKKLGAAHMHCFLHYPPISSEYECLEITDMLQRYGVTSCSYGHLHGYGHKIRFEGAHKGVEYRLISADYVRFLPVKI